MSRAAPNCAGNLSCSSLSPAGILAYGGQWLLNQRQKKQVDTYGVCGLSNQKTRQLFENQIVDEAQLLSLGDYLYYGETLNLYHETYNRSGQDLFAGKTVILRNVCTGLVLFI